jgi:YfiH family protein
MITPPGADGRVIFSAAVDGDLRLDGQTRVAFARRVGIESDWASLDQVHGAAVIEVSSAGNGGAADALWTSARDLPLAVFTADCFPVVLMAPAAVGIAHAGWRGVAAGVVANLRKQMTDADFGPESAFIGPGIGPCCFEVGEEVAEHFPGITGETTWGTVSVDLRSAIRSQLCGIHVWESSSCTMHDPGWYSHRAHGAQERQATIAWT